MNIVSVQQPNRQNDGLAKVAQVLNIIQSAYGIKTDSEQAKLRDESLKSAKRQNEIAELNRRGIYTPDQEADFYHVTPDVKGAQERIFIRPEYNDKNQLVYDPVTGQPKEKNVKVWTISKSDAGIINQLNSDQKAAYALARAKIIEEGGIPPEDIFKYDIVYSPKSGYRPTHTVINGNREEFFARLREKTGKGGTDENLPEWAKGNSDLKSGYYEAIRAGIEEPTADDAFKNSPKNIAQAKKDWVNKMDASTNKDIDIYLALKRADDLFGIDKGIKSDKTLGSQDEPIEGIGLWSDTKDLIPGVGKMTLSENAIKNRSAIQGVINLLLAERSGAAINTQEANRLANELGTAYGQNNPYMIRDVLAQIRTKLKMGLKTIESNLPPKALQEIYSDGELLHSRRELFQGTGSKITDKQALDNYINGR